MEIFSIDKDNVVNAAVALGRSNYEFAIEHLYPLVDRLDIQRNVQNPRFYDRLARDIVRGCLMPPITLAFVLEDDQDVPATPKEFKNYIVANLDRGFILDGIQRLNTLHRASSSDDFPLGQSIFLNIILCSSVDNLLYRMITLNNGQRPMTARHQVEILTSNAFDFGDSKITLAAEKEGKRSRPGLFKRADFEIAYMAFLSGSVAVDSQKLIQEKLDELLANKILERDPSEDGVEFYEVVEFIGELIAEPRVEAWFKVVNNLIGFCASIRSVFIEIKYVEAENFLEFVEKFESAFRSFDVSKIKLGRARRLAVSYAISKYPQVLDEDVSDLTERLTDVIE